MATRVTPWLVCLVALAFVVQIADSEPNSRLCIKNTGGSCLTTACYSWRESTGQVTCDVGRCFCDSGSCSGTDSACYTPDRQYDVIGTPNVTGTTWYTFRNARWPDLVLRTASLATNEAIYAVSSVADASKFSLVAPPTGQGQTPAFLIYNKKWGDSVLQWKQTQDADGNTVYNIACKGITLVSSAAMPNLLTSIVVAPIPQNDGSPLFMLKSFQHNAYVYISMTTNSMSSLPVYREDPGAGGYWHIDPPLPADVLQRLVAYSGQRCSNMCGNVGMVSAASRIYGMASVFILVLSSSVLFTGV